MKPTIKTYFKMNIKENKMKLSDQAIGALLMTLQKCLSEQTDITLLMIKLM